VMATVPFLILFQFGFLYVGFKSLMQGRGAAGPATAVVGSDERAVDAV
jgi:hypothetical protein